MNRSQVTKVYFWGGMAAKRASLPTITITKTKNFRPVNSELTTQKRCAIATSFMNFFHL